MNGRTIRAIHGKSIDMDALNQGHIGAPVTHKHTHSYCFLRSLNIKVSFLTALRSIPIFIQSIFYSSQPRISHCINQRVCREQSLRPHSHPGSIGSESRQTQGLVPMTWSALGRRRSFYPVGLIHPSDVKSGCDLQRGVRDVPQSVLQCDPAPSDRPLSLCVFCLKTPHQQSFSCTIDRFNVRRYFHHISRPSRCGG